jgi:thymidylate synthase (FAD)
MKAEYVTHSGDDLLVCNAARVSFDKETQAYIVPQADGTDRMVLQDRDVKLLRYLAKHNHWTPFAHPQITLRMSAPVPIRTQCFKHKQGFVENEESRRYIKYTPELYVPDQFRMAAENVKQGSAGKHPDSDWFRQRYIDKANECLTMYEYMINRGVCPEQARFILPQGCLVNWMWTGSLAAFARFYRQRTDPHAQREVQMLAEKVGVIVEPLFPVSWRALTASA